MTQHAEPRTGGPSMAGTLLRTGVTFLVGAGVGAILAHQSRDTGEVTPFGEKAPAPSADLQVLRAQQAGRGRDAVSPLSIPWAGWKDILVRTYQQIGEDRLLAVAAGVVFLALLAVFPAITAIVSLYGLFADISVVNDHLAVLSSVVPSGAYSVIHDQVARVVLKSDGSLGFGFAIGLALALWSANAGVKAIIDSLNVVYGESEKRGFLLLNAVSLAFTFGAIAFALGAIGMVIIFPLILERIGLSNQAEMIIAILRWPAFALVMLFGLALLYRFGPSRRGARWEWLSVGSVFAALTWLAGSAGLSFYLSNFADYNATYGTLGAAIGFMMWMWMSTIVILVGAELNAEIEHQTAIDTTTGRPKPMGARGATMADTLGKTAEEV